MHGREQQALSHQSPRRIVISLYQLQPYLVAFIAQPRWRNFTFILFYQLPPRYLLSARLLIFSEGVYRNAFCLEMAFTWKPSYVYLS